VQGKPEKITTTFTSDLLRNASTCSHAYNNRLKAQLSIDKFKSITDLEKGSEMIIFESKASNSWF